MRTSISTAALALALIAAGGVAVARPGGGMGMQPMSSPHSFSSPRATSTTTTVQGPVRRMGQPNQSCQSGANYPANTPGNSFNAPGSAFNPNGVADAKYAGTQPQNSNNPKSVAQYDVACSNQK